MPNAFIAPSDLAPFAQIDEAKASAMIDDAYARAARVAPCLQDEDFQADPGNVAVVRSVLRAAILRRNDAGSGATQYQTAGPFAQQTATGQPHRSMLWPSEIEELQAVCAAYSGTSSGGAFSINTSPAG